MVGLRPILVIFNTKRKTNVLTNFCSSFILLSTDRRTDVLSEFQPFTGFKIILLHIICYKIRNKGNTVNIFSLFYNFTNNFTNNFFLSSNLFTPYIYSSIHTFSLIRSHTHTILKKIAISLTENKKKIYKLH